MLNKKKIRILGVNACVVLLTSVILSSNVSAASSTVKRLYGADRYSTNIDIVSSGWSSSDNIVIASGENYPDALCAAPFAKAKGAPIILTSKNSLGSSQLNQLVNLKVKNAYIIGGTGVITTNVETQLKALGINYRRFAGRDRYETSVKVAQQLTTDNGIMVASGENFPDALSAAPIAAAKKMPILLSSKDRLPDSIKTYLTNKNIPISYIIGGPGALSSNIETGLIKPKRLYGADRYKTNINIMKEFQSSLNFENLYIASGNNFPDALSGSVLASNSNSPIALVDTTLSAGTSDYVKTQNIKIIYVLGGTGAVNQTVEATLKNIANFLAISKVDDVSDLAFINEDYHFPPYALVTYDNSSQKLVKVKWNSDTLDTSKEGSFSYTGTVDGYNGKIKLTTKVIQETGSINGNLPNNGLIAYYKGTNYYCNPNDDNKIYKMTDGITEGTKLSDDTASGINIVNDTIYYINDSDHRRAYRMKLDGSQRTKLTDVRLATSLLVTGDTIYYADNYSENQGIYKMNSDGTNKIKLCDGRADNLVMENGYLYFIGNGDSSSYMYTMKPDGSEKRKINNDSVSIFSIENGWIYYNSFNGSYRLYKVKLDGTNRTSIVDEQIRTLNVNEGWIYYTRIDGEDYKLYKVRTDGSDEMKLSDKIVSFIYTIGDYVFYKTSYFNQKIYSIRRDGVGEKRFARPFIFDTEPNNTIASSQAYKLMDNSEDASVIAGSIQSGDIDMYKLNLSSSDTINIFFSAPSLGENAIITVFGANGEKIYSIQTDASGNAGLRLDVTSGAHYIKVTLKNGSTASGNYNMINWVGDWE
jgi:putative cell wall-binding protein